MQLGGQFAKIAPFGLGAQILLQAGGLLFQRRRLLPRHHIGVFRPQRHLADGFQRAGSVGEGVLFNQEQHVFQFVQRVLRRFIGGVIGQFQLDMAHFEFAENGAFFFNDPGVLGIGFDHILFQQGQLFIEILLAGALARLALEQHGLGQLLADAHDGVQGGKGVLKNHGDFIAPEAIEILLRNFQQILPVVENFAALSDGVACLNAQDGLGRDGFARAGFAHDGQRFALMQVKADAPHGLHLAGAGAEGNAQIAHL